LALRWLKGRLDNAFATREMRLMRLLLALICLMATTGPARADLSVCNKSSHRVIVALGHFNGSYWAGKGWWRLAPTACFKLISGPLNARYYYFYATDGAFLSWDGDKPFCVGALGQFSDLRRGNCAKRGLNERGFFEVDTGNHLDWTQVISDPH
jgi:uncharacterized membrane protein